MLCALLLAGLAMPQAAAPQSVTRSVTVAVYTKKSEPVADLKAEEVSVAEDGKKRTVLGLEPDTRPLEVAVVIDSSVSMASSYRSDLVSAVTTFWKSLAPGSRVAVWTSGPPSKVVVSGTDLATAEPRLQAVAPAGKNYALDALLDAARGMTASGDARRVLVYVGGGDIEGSQSRSAEMVRAIGQAGATPMIVLIMEAPRPPRFREGRARALRSRRTYRATSSRSPRATAAAAPWCCPPRPRSRRCRTWPPTSPLSTACATRARPATRRRRRWRSAARARRSAWGGPRSRC